VITFKNVLKVAVVAAMFHAAPAVVANDLDTLLQEVSASRAQDEKVFQQRVATYNAASPGEQASMLAEAQGKRDALALKSDALAVAFSANEVKLRESNKALRDKIDALGLTQVFGLSRQVAGDLSIALQQSLISSQLKPEPGQPPRSEVLRQLSTAKNTPTTEDLERIWFEMQREMIASGQVARYQTDVVQPGGEVVDATVVRVGPFNAVSDGKHLAYNPELQSLTVYPRQPPSDILAYGRALESASEGYVQTVVDSARGVLMGLYVERPTWVDRIKHGEHINYVILLVGAVAALAFLFQFVYLVLVRLKVGAQLKNLDKPTNDNPLGRVLLAFKGDPKNIEQDSDAAELRISEAVSRELPKLERAQALLSLSVAAGPLLGLIGTVLGMIITFQSITESGSSDPKLMAAGIGAAMIATVLGLGIAIPLLFGNALLGALSRGVTQVLEEQSAGMLAESIERAHRV